MNRFDTFSIKELTLTTIAGNSFDLRENLVELSVFSSVYDSSMSAQLFVHDSFNLIENAPILGGETVSFKWKTEGRHRTQSYNFKVYKIGTRTTVDSVQGYVLYLTTADAYLDANTAVSSAFLGEYHKCVANALSYISSKVSLVADDTTGALDKAFISPNWTPLQICEWMANRAMDQDGNPVLFYENEDGYQFRTLSTIYNQRAWSRFVYEPQDALGYDQERTIHNMSTFTIQGSRNALANAQEGIFNTELTTYDFATKRVERNIRDYKKSTEPRIDKNKLEFDETIDRRFARFVETQFDGSHNGDYQRRVAAFLLNQFVVTALMTGDSDLRVGMIVDFDVPAAEPLNKGILQKEERNSGRFLVSSIKLTFTRQNCTAGVELSKDSQSQLRG